MDGEQTPPDPNTAMPPKQPHDFEAASEETRDYADLTPPEYRSKLKKKRKWPIIVIAVVPLIAIGGAGYWFLLRPEPKPQTKQIATPSEQAEEETETTELKHYISNQFTLAFDYPSNWELADTEESGKLTLTSPATRLKDSSGQTVTGQIVITIRDKRQLLPEFDKGNATAARASEKIAYKKPSQGQRAQTFLSFLHVAGTITTDTAVESMFITGDAGYQAGQAIPKADILPIEPVISVSFFKCADKFCVNPTPLGISAANWDDKSFADPIKNILISLTIS